MKMLDVIASKLEKDVQKAKHSKKPSVFLGGSCEDNEWRKGVKKEFGDSFFFLDPYDENWDPTDNIYDELAGMINADWIIFFKGGKQSKREKDFLENVDMPDNFKEFESLSELKSFLQRLKDKKAKRFECVSAGLYRCAGELIKQSMPWIHRYPDSIDLFFEDLDQDSKNLVTKDFSEGKIIHIPSMSIPGKGYYPAVSFSKSDFPEDYFNKILEYMKMFCNKKSGVSESLEYDFKTQSYRKKEAKIGVEYSSSSTQVDLPEDLARNVFAWGKANIPDNALYTDDEAMGRENEIHITVFYGIKSSDPDEVLKLLRGFKPFECRLGLITVFKDCKTHDVLKIDVESAELIKLHYLLEDNLDNKNKYPTYHPHVTIAYLKKGKADRFLGDDHFRGKTFNVNEISFSSKDHTKTKISLIA
jgi:2'-5' RNA ligase